MADKTVGSELRVVVTLKLRFKPNTIDDVLNKIMPIVEMTRKEPGNVEFTVYRARDDDDQLVIFEQWVDQAALAHHWKLDYTREALEIFEQNLLMPLSEERDVSYLHEVRRV